MSKQQIIFGMVYWDSHVLCFHWISSGKWIWNYRSVDWVQCIGLYSAHNKKFNLINTLVGLTVYLSLITDISPFQHWYQSANLHGVTSQKFFIYNILKYHILCLQGCLISDAWSILRKWRATQSYSWRTTGCWTRKLKHLVRFSLCNCSLL